MTFRGPSGRGLLSLSLSLSRSLPLCFALSAYINVLLSRTMYINVSNVFYIHIYIYIYIYVVMLIRQWANVVCTDSYVLSYPTAIINVNYINCLLIGNECLCP